MTLQDKFMNIIISTLNHEQIEYEITKFGNEYHLVKLLNNSETQLFVYDVDVTVSEDKLNLGFYREEFESDEEVLRAFSLDIKSIVTSRYPKNLDSFIGRILVTHYSPNPGSKLIKYKKRLFVSVFFMVLIILLFFRFDN